ncbi:MAG: redoxin domain-containing protein [Bacteroidia bacterium]|nr:redoxin domain-containing protein [Bacteroidia bacterium]
MKQIIYFLSLVVFTGFISLSAQAQKKMPAFTFEDLNARPFTNTNIKQGLSTIVFFYDPYCEHCAQQADWIRESEAAFKNINLVWVSTEDLQPIQEFKAAHFGGTTLDKLYFVRDTKWKFDTYFGYTVAPGVYLYNKDNILLKSYSKETPAIDFLKALSGK